jgi:hypothetical protein
MPELRPLEQFGGPPSPPTASESAGSFARPQRRRSRGGLSASKLAPQSVPIASIVRCLVALVARRRTTASSAGTWPQGQLQGILLHPAQVGGSESAGLLPPPGRRRTAEDAQRHRRRPARALGVCSDWPLARHRAVPDRARGARADSAPPDAAALARSAPRPRARQRWDGFRSSSRADRRHQLCSLPLTRHRRQGPGGERRRSRTFMAVSPVAQIVGGSAPVAAVVPPRRGSGRRHRPSAGRRAVPGRESPRGGR